MANRPKYCAICLASLAGTLLAASSSHAQSVFGVAEVVNGDSLAIGDRQVRLFGIDAPEYDQSCNKHGTTWACGQTAKEQLASLVAGHRVECRGQGVDEHARILVVCTAGGVELNRVMVEQGWAVAYRQYSDAYIAAELQAKAHGLGIWSSTFVTPSDYRHAKLPPEPRVPARAPLRLQSRPQAWRAGCLIKGNHSRNGEWIYHLPGMPYYEQTRAEAMFCTEEEAIAAGYRKSRAGN